MKKGGIKKTEGVDLEEIEGVILKRIGDRIKQLRKDAGYKNYENFAFDNDLNRVQYGKMESGINFTIRSLLKILAAHNITLEQFFTGL